MVLCMTQQLTYPALAEMFGAHRCPGQAHPDSVQSAHRLIKAGQETARVAQGTKDASELKTHHASAQALWLTGPLEVAKQFHDVTLRDVFTGTTNRKEDAQAPHQGGLRLITFTYRETSAHRAAIKLPYSCRKAELMHGGPLCISGSSQLPLVITSPMPQRLTPTLSAIMVFDFHLDLQRIEVGKAELDSNGSVQWLCTQDIIRPWHFGHPDSQSPQVSGPGPLSDAGDNAALPDVAVRPAV